ncbi:MAG TPA: histidine kinase dimerization/phosphoacceptor domain -containing protein [Micropepsaceae bacterium]|nr:histidine kinase dimerization/phosphoacceptor domain -containing protein [Micropepsaceae bacterium]
MSIWDWLFNPSGLTAHGFCLSWAPGLIAVHVLSDSVIGLAYFSIPLALASFAAQRKDLEYGWVAYLFVAFILACGLTHLMSILTLWSPAYGIEGIIKLVTAVLSIATAMILWPLIPKLLALPSSAQLKELNVQLATTIEEQARTARLLRESEAQVRLSNLELERRVAERTAQLVVANAQLTETLAALAKSEEEFRVTFEAAAVGKTQADPETGCLIRANHAFARMLGYEPEELVGRAGWEFTWPEDREAERIDYAHFLASGGDIYIREKRYIRKDGTPIWGRVSSTIVRFPESGKPNIRVAVIEDIDERYKAQAALVVAKRDLEGVVKERTEALQQRDLLLREVYHRVKNNLQIIDSILMMQARQLTDPEAKVALQSLRSRVYALGLVHHQLMGSENLQTFDVAPFLQELSNNIIEGSAGRDITLSVRAIPLDVGLDFAIPLGLLVTELVTNSLKHAFPNGKGKIEVVLDRAQDGTVALIVSDDGRGYGINDTVSGGRKVGLGASIINGVVAQLKATLTVQNQHGTRSEICIAVPASA